MLTKDSDINDKIHGVVFFWLIFVMLFIFYLYRFFIDSWFLIIINILDLLRWLNIQFSLICVAHLAIDIVTKQPYRTLDS